MTATKIKATSMTVEAAVEPFQEYLTAIGKSPKTIHNTVTTIYAWMTFAKTSETHPNDITEVHVGKWINNPKSASVARTRLVNLSSLRLFFRFLVTKGWAVRDPSLSVEVNYDRLDHRQKEIVEKQPLTKEELKQAVSELEKRRDSFWLFAVMASAELGLRMGDVCEMEWASFNQAGKIVVWTGKRNKRIEMPISSKLEELVAEIPVEHDKYMFPLQRDQHRDPTKRAGLSVWFTRFLKSLKIEGKSFHSIRHMVATQKYAKADKETLAKKLAESLTLEQIATLLGHSNTKTTKKYIH